MANIGNDAKGTYLRFQLPGFRRRKVRLAGWSLERAETAKHHVEVLVRAAKRRQPIPVRTLDWVAAEAPEGLRHALADAGLVDDRRLLGAAADAWVHLAGKPVSQARVDDFARVTERIVQWFGADYPVAALTDEGIDEWAESLTGIAPSTLAPSTIAPNTLAPNTIAKYCKIAQQFCGWLVAEKLIDRTPAAALPVTTSAAADRQIVPAAIVDRLIAACRAACRGGDAGRDAGIDHPDQLAAALGLARYGGLRFGEIMRVQVADIDAGPAKRLTIRDTKRNRPRHSPLFPQLAATLEPVLALRAGQDRTQGPPGLLLPELAALPARSVTRQLERLAESTGTTLWPRPWHNMRATRETELIADFGIVDACLWIGNSPAIAAKHYAMAREEVFQRAIKAAAA